MDMRPIDEVVLPLNGKLPLRAKWRQKSITPDDLEQALYGIIFLPPSGPGRVVVKGSVPLLREGEAVEGGDEGKQEIGLGSGEGVVSWGEGEG